jgi:5-bromo-4-chloroindolyl phosphate hydrolysis protein
MKYLLIFIIIISSFICGILTGISHNSAAYYLQESIGQRKYLKEGDIVREPDGLCGYVTPIEPTSKLPKEKK